MRASPISVTQLLAEWRAGQPAALDRLWPVVQDELRRLAKHHMRKERSGHTLQTTALVNEAYLKLVDRRDIGANSRGQFFALASRIMRCLLVDHARKRNYLKRGGGIRPMSMDEGALVSQAEADGVLAVDEGALVSQAQADEVLAVDAALTRLEVNDPRKIRIIELRYFAGLGVEETAEALSISTITVKREWRKAKAWLHRELTEGQER